MLAIFAPDAYSLSDPTPEALAAECCAIPEIERKSSWGGARPGAGRPRKAPGRVIDLAAPIWCVFIAHNQAEMSAARELTRQGYETYLPLIAIRRRDPVLASLWHEVRVPLLPGYGFIRVAPRESREPILATRGIRAVLLRPDGRPASLPDGEIDRLRAGDETRLRLPKEHRPILALGAVVRIEAGPFASFPGEVLECDGRRTCVAAVIFGRLTPVWLDRGDVSEAE